MADVYHAGLALIVVTACVIVDAMRLRTPRDDDFAAIAAITNHYIATTAVHFAEGPIPEAGAKLVGRPCAAPGACALRLAGRPSLFEGGNPNRVT
jgi:hypothetical protein